MSETQPVEANRVITPFPENQCRQNLFNAILDVEYIEWEPETWNISSETSTPILHDSLQHQCQDIEYGSIGESQTSGFGSSSTY